MTDYANMPREDILPILNEIDALSTKWHEIQLQKQMKEANLADDKMQYEKIQHRKPAVNYKLIYWFLLIAGCMLYFVPGILVYVFLRPKLLLKNEEAIKKQTEKNEREAEAYLKNVIKPLESELSDIKESVDELTRSGKIEWAKDIVGVDIFNGMGVGDLIGLISSHRADTLKETLNLYDSVKHRERMEEMQEGMLANTDAMAMESAKQTNIASKIEKNTRETATASKWTAVNTYRTYRNTKRK